METIDIYPTLAELARAAPADNLAADPRFGPVVAELRAKLHETLPD